jgi:hypothetical protein
MGHSQDPHPPVSHSKGSFRPDESVSLNHFSHSLADMPQRRPSLHHWWLARRKTDLWHCSPKKLLQAVRAFTGYAIHWHYIHTN